MALVMALYAGGLLWLHHLGSVPVPGRFLANNQEFANSEGSAGRNPRVVRSRG